MSHGIYCKKHKNYCKKVSEVHDTLIIGKDYKIYNVLSESKTIIEFKCIMAIPEGQYKFRLLTHGIDLCIGGDEMLSDQKDWNMHKHPYSLRVNKINVDKEGQQMSNRKLELIKGKENGSFIGNLKLLKDVVSSEKMSFKHDTSKTVYRYKLLDSDNRTIGYFFKNHDMYRLNQMEKALHSDEGYYDQCSVRYSNNEMYGYILTGTQNDNYHNIQEGVDCLFDDCKQCLKQ